MSWKVDLRSEQKKLFKMQSHHNLFGSYQQSSPLRKKSSAHIQDKTSHYLHFPADLLFPF
ncbi:hypothetical protein SLEP1_g26745 [Rubroshorea leprosula]|uniref:Uncharacterized protein n=1 Tax=Rubroshorea leprosula TaxID=152421 RepID=A0AAV5JXC5_9ROSI|nr:hypothetical protein SLEP1_g26745 [Rubroshorea leprosula]